MTELQTEVDENEDFAKSFNEFSDDGANKGNTEDDAAADNAAADDNEDTNQPSDQEPDPSSSTEGDEGAEGDEVPVDYKEKYEALEKKYTDIEHRYRSETGRVATIQRNYALLQQQLAAQKEGAAADNSGKADNGNNDDNAEGDELSALREEYPEIAEPLEKVLNASREKEAALSERLQRMDQERYEAHVNTETGLLSEKHSDWVSIANSDDFHQWVATQPQLIVDALKRNEAAIVDHAEAALVISLFKDSQAPQEVQQQPSNEPKKSKRDLQRKSAASPRSSPSTGGSDGVVDDFAAAFERYAT